MGSIYQDMLDARAIKDVDSELKIVQGHLYKLPSGSVVKVHLCHVCRSASSPCDVVARLVPAARDSEFRRMRTSKLSAQAIHEIRYGAGTREEKAKRFGISPTTVTNVIRNGTTTRPSGKSKGYEPKPFDPTVVPPRTYVNAAMRETYKPQPWGRV